MMFQTSSSSTTNTPASWDGSDDTTCHIHNIASRLLQLSAGTPPAGYTRMAVACPKRSCAVNPQAVGSRRPNTRSASAALGTLAYPLQVVFHYEVYLVECVQTVADNVSRSGLRSSNSTLRRTAATNEIRETGIFTCRSAAWNSLLAKIRDLPTFRNKLKSYFLILRIVKVVVYYFILWSVLFNVCLLTIVMRLCSFL